MKLKPKNLPEKIQPRLKYGPAKESDAKIIAKWRSGAISTKPINRVRRPHRARVYKDPVAWDQLPALVQALIHQVSEETGVDPSLFQVRMSLGPVVTARPLPITNEEKPCPTLDFQATFGPSAGQVETQLVSREMPV